MWTLLRPHRTEPHQAKLMDADPVILQSARKHGIHDDDMVDTLACARNKCLR
jgi:hypothetical protein